MGPAKIHVFLTMHIEKRIDEARRQLKAFSSLGMTTFDLTLTNANGQKFSFRQGMKAKELIPFFQKQLEIEDAMRQNFLVRPGSSQAVLIQCEDVSRSMLGQVQQFALLGLDMGQHRYHVWFAFEREMITPTFHVELRQKLKALAVPALLRPTRIAGSRVFEEKGPSPIVRCHFTKAKKIVTQDELQHLLGSPPNMESSEQKTWPEYQDVPGNDPDKTDFLWCIKAAACDWPLEAIASELLERSRHARMKGHRYGIVLARKAQKSRGHTPEGEIF